MVVHTAPTSKKEATGRLTMLMRGCTRPQSGPASNRQDTRHSRLQTMLDAEQPVRLLTHLSRCPDDRHEPHPLSLIRDGNELLPVPTPLHDRRYAIGRPTDEPERLMAVTSDRNLAPAARPSAWLGLRALAVLVDPDRRHGDGIIRGGT